MQIDPTLTTTALLLTLAHLAGDYPFQTNWMVANKARVQGMAAHMVVVFAMTLLALKGQIVPALVITGAHLLIDLLKTHALPKTLWAYLMDQALHIATIAIMLLYWPNLASGWGALPPEALYTLAATSGLILSVWFGGPIIGSLMAQFEDAKGESLPRAGLVIGKLERALIFPLVLAGEPAGIGFLIAAKSVLRFDTASKDQKASEYVIIGTLASFAWAIFISFATLGLLRFLEIDTAFS